MLFDNNYNTLNFCQNPKSTTTQLNLNLTYVHIRNISAVTRYWSDFDETLKVGSWEHLEQIPTVTVTFVQATFVLGTFVHIRNISAVTDTIWTKL